MVWQFGIQLLNLMYANWCVLWVLVRESTLYIALISKLNLRQFTLHSNLPNLMFAKYTAYMVVALVYILGTKELYFLNTCTVMNGIILRRCYNYHYKVMYVQYHTIRVYNGVYYVCTIWPLWLQWIVIHPNSKVFQNLFRLVIMQHTA